MILRADPEPARPAVGMLIPLKRNWSHVQNAIVLVCDPCVSTVADIQQCRQEHGLLCFDLYRRQRLRGWRWGSIRSTSGINIAAGKAHTLCRLRHTVAVLPSDGNCTSSLSGNSYAMRTSAP